jgi:hypothetical protein
MKPRERRLLRFVQAFRATHGDALPSLSAVGAGLGIRNETKVRRLVDSLIGRGQLAAGAVLDDGVAGGLSGGTGGGGGGGDQN